MNDLKVVYGHLCTDRFHYVDAADDVSKLTLPALDPRGDNKPEQHRPYSYVGGMAIRSLASSMLATMLPSGVKWAKLDLSPEAWAIVEDQFGPEFSAALRDRLDERTNQIIESLEQKLARSRGARAFRRNLVEGSTLIANKRMGLQILPLRCFGVDREFGEVRTLAIKEVSTKDPTEIGSDQPAYRGYGETEIYTVIKYPIVDPDTGQSIREGEVWKQVGDEKPKRVKGEDHRQYFVFVPEIPEHENYPYGYAYDYLRLFYQINHGEQSLGEAMFAAAYNRPIIREGSSSAAQWEDFASGASGRPWIGNPEDFSWFTAAIKIGDWAFITQLMERWNRDLGKAFAMGIKDRPTSGSTSATEVLQIVDELNTQMQDLHTAYEETFQRRLFESEMILFEQVDPLIPGDEEALRAIKVEITTGTSVLEKQQALLKFVTNVLPGLQQMDPMRFQINSGPIASAFADTMAFPTDQFYTWTPMAPQPQAVEDPAAGGEELPREETIMTPGGPQPPQNGVQPGSPQPV